MKGDLKNKNKTYITSSYEQHMDGKENMGDLKAVISEELKKGRGSS